MAASLGSVGRDVIADTFPLCLGLLSPPPLPRCVPPPPFPIFGPPCFLLRENIKRSSSTSLPYSYSLPPPRCPSPQPISFPSPSLATPRPHSTHPLHSPPPIQSTFLLPPPSTPLLPSPYPLAPYSPLVSFSPKLSPSPPLSTLTFFLTSIPSLS